MSVIKKIKRGLNIRISGSAERKIYGDVNASVFGIRPGEFHGITPKLNVKPGDKVKAGTEIFSDKARTDLRFSSPVSGTIREIKRGEQRRILEIVIEKTGDDYIDFGKSDPSLLSADEIKKKLLESGIWPMIRQRPYHIIAASNKVPKSIFISGFDTSPLAPDMNFIMDNTDVSDFQTGINALGKLTSGKVNLVLSDNTTASSLLRDVKGVERHFISGPHPAGNVGVQIHHIDPINKGETVWFVNLQDVAVIGKFFNKGIYSNDRIVALAGSEALNRGYYKIRYGSSVASLVEGNARTENVRYISGNVLTGSGISSDGFLGFYDNMLTIIPEGNYFEFFGWMMPGLSKYSFSKTFLSSLVPAKNYVLDTNLHGGYRAFVVTGEYEKVVPMDIYPMQLLKAILAEDIDSMENLGIYEIAEEDFALCEFICPSKTEIQSIVRKGLNLMVKEMN